MKIPRGLKITLYVLSLALYASGVAAWIFSRWFQIDEGFGAGPRAIAAQALHLHGIVSLFFLVLFGILLESHVKKGWRARRKLKSGLLLVSPLIIVMLTVPGLYYLNDGVLKVSVTQIHTVLGLALFVPLLIHIFTKVKDPSVSLERESRKRFGRFGRRGRVGGSRGRSDGRDDSGRSSYSPRTRPSSNR